ncbi:hypothetical protein KIN20_031691 [Parelaphostrongylus tenuis]|uniref:Uncharacterized protein n=1 Tax=Parelaphostrongylus tenuis TaxID=148309 RepID=A0AAD5WHF2_PARTN|nr:hypothetical protein KIN20_031691 [Parelaphostrongylus tenuis]
MRKLLHRHAILTMFVLNERIQKNDQSCRRSLSSKRPPYSRLATVDIAMAIVEDGAPENTTVGRVRPLARGEKTRNLKHTVKSDRKPERSRVLSWATQNIPEPVHGQ